MNKQIDPNQAIDYLLKNAGKFAKAKAERVYLEEFRKTKKAILMGDAPDGTVAAKEQYAYSHQDYKSLLEGLREAVEIEEKLRWDMLAAQMRVEVWRSQEASNRSVDKTLR